MTLFILLCLGVAALFILLLGRHRLYESPISGMVLVLTLLLLDEARVPLPIINVGVSLFLRDVVAFALFGLGIVRLLNRYRPKPIHLVFFLLLSMYALSCLRGIDIYGVQSAMNGARNDFYFFSALLYFSTFNYSEELLQKAVKVILVAVCLLMAIVAMWWFAVAFHISVPMQISHRMYIKPMAVITGKGTFFLACTMVIFLYLELQGRTNRFMRGMIYALAITILFLQQRSVWIASIVGFSWLFFRLGYSKSAVWGRLIVVGLLGLVLIVAFSGNRLDYIYSTLKASVAEIGAESSPWTARYESWYALLLEGKLKTGKDWLIGLPYGSGFVRFIEGRMISWSPHNFFVFTILRMGLIGLFLLLLMYSTLLLSTRRLEPHKKKSSLYLGPEIIQALLLMQIVFCIPGRVHMIEGLFFGISSGIVMSLSRRPELISRTKPYGNNPNSSSVNLL